MPERAKETDVTSYINEKTPPFFIVHGMADPVVSIEHSEYLYDALDAKNIRVELLKVRDACSQGLDTGTTGITDIFIL